MNRPVFGKKQPKLPSHLDRILVPQGAASSAETWSLAMALVEYVTTATDRAFFLLEELPADAVAVFRAYELSGDVDKEIGYLFVGERYGEKASQVADGLRLIGMDALADVIETAKAAWNGCSGRPEDEQYLVMNGFNTSRGQEVGIEARCSDWVRSSDLTLVLGDGRLDTVYKEVMKQLYRCNPNYAERRSADDERRIRLNGAPVGPPPLGP